MCIGAMATGARVAKVDSRGRHVMWLGRPANGCNAVEVALGEMHAAETSACGVRFFRLPWT